MFSIRGVINDDQKPVRSYIIRDHIGPPNKTLIDLKCYNGHTAASLKQLSEQMITSQYLL